MDMTHNRIFMGLRTRLKKEIIKDAKVTRNERTRPTEENKEDGVQEDGEK